MAETLKRPTTKPSIGYEKKISSDKPSSTISPEKRRSLDRPKKTEAKTDKSKKLIDAAATNPNSNNKTSNGNQTSSLMSTLEKMRDGGPVPNDPNKIRNLMTRTVKEMEGLKIEINAKKDEIQELRSKVVELRRDLSGVNTSKSVLNEYCVTGMVDCMAMNNQINQLKMEKGSLERANEQLKKEAEDRDEERRGLLNLIDEGKVKQKEFEKLYESEIAKRKEAESSKISIMERLGLELKWVRKELEEKSQRLKKLARTNAKLACKLLTLEVDNSEARGIANMLQKQNKQLEGDNQELSGCVLQLENQIGQMAYEKTATFDSSIPEEPSDLEEIEEELLKLEEDRNTLISKIHALENSIAKLEQKLDDDPVFEDEIERISEEKIKLEWEVKEMTHNIETLKMDKEKLEAEIESVQEDHVQELHDESNILRAKVKELEIMLEAAKARESEYQSDNQKAVCRITKLEDEKRVYEEKLEELASKLNTIGSEMEAKYSGMQREREMQVAEFGDQKKDLQENIKDLETCLKEYESVKQESDDMLRKLGKDLREVEQEREMLSKQVNVLEWHLTDTYREKMDAVQALEEKDMEIMHLTQELANKEEDYERLKKEIIQENEDLQMQVHELQVARKQALETSALHKRRSMALEQQVERLQKEKYTSDDSIKKMKNRKPWFSFSIEFKF